MKSKALYALLIATTAACGEKPQEPQPYNVILTHGNSTYHITADRHYVRSIEKFRSDSGRLISTTTITLNTQTGKVTTKASNTRYSENVDEHGALQMFRRGLRYDNSTAYQIFTELSEVVKNDSHLQNLYQWMQIQLSESPRERHIQNEVNNLVRGNLELAVRQYLHTMSDNLHLGREIYLRLAKESPNRSVDVLVEMYNQSAFDFRYFLTDLLQHDRDHTLSLGQILYDRDPAMFVSFFAKEPGEFHGMEGMKYDINKPVKVDLASLIGIAPTDSIAQYVGSSLYQQARKQFFHDASLGDIQKVLRRIDNRDLIKKSHGLDFGLRFVRAGLPRALYDLIEFEPEKAKALLKRDPVLFEEAIAVSDYAIATLQARISRLPKDDPSWRDDVALFRYSQRAIQEFMTGPK